MLPTALLLCASAVAGYSLPPLRAAVIMPGFLNDANDFSDLAAELNAAGIKTTVVPFSFGTGCVRGRALCRPILSASTTRCATSPPRANRAAMPASPLDLWNDFREILTVPGDRRRL